MCRFLSWFRPDHFFTEGSIIMDYGFVFKPEGKVEVKNVLMIDLFFLQTRSFSLLETLTDGLEWCGLLWCFYQLFGLSFWRHPFTAHIHFLVNYSFKTIHTNLSTIFHCRNRSKYMLVWYTANGAPLRYSWSSLQDPNACPHQCSQTHMYRCIDNQTWGTDFWHLLNIFSETLSSMSQLLFSSSLSTISRTLEDWTHTWAWKHLPSGETVI